MFHRFPALAPLLGLLAALFVLMASASPTHAAPASLTYTGQLLSSTSPPAAVSSGSYDLKFQLYTAATGGLPYGSPVSLPSVPVVSGIYYVQLYFGALFTGTTYWIQVSYRLAGSTGAYTLVPTRPIAPDAAYANYAALSGNTLALQGKGISTTAPSAGQVLTYNGTLWTPATPASGGSYTAGPGLTLTGNQFSVAVPLALSAASSGPLLSVTNTSSGYNGIVGAATGSNSAGVEGSNDSGIGVFGTSSSNYGVLGTSSSGTGGWFTTTVGPQAGYFSSTASAAGTYGVYATGGATALYGTTAVSSGSGVYGVNTSGGDYGLLGGMETYEGNALPVGVYGNDTFRYGSGYSGGMGVWGQSISGYGVYGESGEQGVFGYCDFDGGGAGGYFGAVGSSRGVYGYSDKGNGGEFWSKTGTGVRGTSGNTGSFGLLGGVDPVYQEQAGVFGESTQQGVFGYSTTNSSIATGVYGATTGQGYGVRGETTAGTGVQGKNDTSGDYGLLGSVEPFSGTGKPVGVLGNDVSTGSGGGYGVYGASTNGIAGYFRGNVTVTGAITAGTKDFKIDHPLDPAGKYLYHASVESDKMEDVYHGHVLLDARGAATVQMPAWFQSLNTDLEYQLTAVGAPGPNLYVAQKMKDNEFGIAGGQPGAEVSWQVTGVRQDAYARAHPLQVEEDKPEGERGLYQNPEAFGLPADRGIGDAKQPAHLRPAPPSQP